MESKFDEILAFAEIDKFIDTPVKHYSSGMYVRLAFAVAAHLEPEILLIDEVLAVGDAAFQKKCLGKMDDVTKEGRTVLFVSHNMPMILRLCHRGILLENGRIAGSGNVQKIIEQYLAGAQSISSLNDLSRCSRNGSGKIRFKEFCVSNEDGNPWLYPDQPALFRMKLETDTPGLLSSNVKIAIGVNAGTGERILELHTKFDHEYQKELFPFEKDTTIVCKTKAFPIKPGIYYLTLYVDYSHELCDGLKDVIQIEVRESDFFETGVLPSNTQGWLLLNQHWSQEK
jgi:lipopolysaccharide transport system ATP-binding protein